MEWQIKPINPGRPELGYTAKDGTFFETVQDYIESGVVGLCGCGFDGNLELVQEILRCADTRGGWKNAEEHLLGWVEQNPRYAAHILLHLLTDKDLLEHGGSVSASWLTKTGEAVLDFEVAHEDQ